MLQTKKGKETEYRHFIAKTVAIRICTKCIKGILFLAPGEIIRGEELSNNMPIGIADGVIDIQEEKFAVGWDETCFVAARQSDDVMKTRKYDFL